ncbi:MAG: acyl-CoA thioesterase [Cyclobacteriaceae bacterium]|nr:acyl-CoA thioesterase [Cyclobacteriaceae bacterium]
MYKSITNVRVRYAETDQMGYVYYGNYLTYYEVARVESLKNLGISYKELESEGIIMPVVENWSKYIAPARYDDLLKIEVSIQKLPGLKIRFHYEIFNESGKLIHIGDTSLVFLNPITGKPTEPPEKILKVLEPYFSDEK